MGNDRCYFDNVYLEGITSGGSSSCSSSNNVILDRLSDSNGYNVEYEYKGTHNNRPYYRGITGSRQYLYYSSMHNNYHLNGDISDCCAVAFCRGTDITKCTTNTWHELDGNGGWKTDSDAFIATCAGNNNPTK